MEASGKKIIFQTHADRLKVFMYVMNNYDEVLLFNRNLLVNFVS